MNNNWAEVRRQLDQVLESERAQCQARRRCQQPFGQSLRQWGATARRFARRVCPLSISITFTR
jgi:hypothetical protein